MKNNTSFLLGFIYISVTACTQTPIKQPPVVISQPNRPPSVPSKSPVNNVPYETVEQIEKKPDLPSNPVVNPAKEHKPRVAPPASPVASAVSALVTDAEKISKAGDLESASVMLERALRISPRDAELTYKLAELRLKQSQPRLAEDLGKKAAFLADGDTALKKRCWLLIAQARRLQQDFAGAEQAQLKADSLE
jgi:predicted Zn-dependent protease